LFLLNSRRAPGPLRSPARVLFPPTGSSLPGRRRRDRRPAAAC